MAHGGLVRQIALLLARTVDQPDVPALVAAVVAEERELRSIGRPAGRHAPFGPSRELVERLLRDRRAVDLEVAGLVPAERDLVSRRREIDGAEAPVNVRRSDEVLDRQPPEAFAQWPRAVLPYHRDDVRRRIRDGRRRALGPGRVPVLRERLRPFGLLRRCAAGARRTRSAVRGCAAVARARRRRRRNRTLGALDEIAALARDDKRRLAHRGLARRGLLAGNDLFVMDHLMLQTPLVRAVPGRRNEDREQLARLRELALHALEVVPAGIPHRRTAG